MKKLLLSAFAVAVCLGGAALMTSCSNDGDDECTCTEKTTGYSEEMDLLGYGSCKALQNALNDTADELGYSQNWSCK